jgi:hypothetical protein
MPSLQRRNTSSLRQRPRDTQATTPRRLNRVRRQQPPVPVASIGSNDAEAESDLAVETECSSGGKEKVRGTVQLEVSKSVVSLPKYQPVCWGTATRGGTLAVSAPAPSVRTKFQLFSVSGLLSNPSNEPESVA